MVKYYVKKCCFMYVLKIVLVHTKIAQEVPEYEIDPSELDFTDSVFITKVLSMLFH